MDANSLRKIIEAQIAQFEGNAFQDMCDRLGMTLFPDDYHPIRAGGRNGDTKNDGYCPKARIFFAAHATRGEAANRTKNKIKDDLEGCLEQHRDVKEWRFLTNETLLGEVDQFVDNNLRPAHKDVTIETWGHKRLADEISKLRQTQIEKILDLTLTVSAAHKESDQKSEVVSGVVSILLALLVDLNLYEEKDDADKLRLLEWSLKEDYDKIEGLLSLVRRVLGSDSDHYIILKDISADISASLKVDHAADGGLSDAKRKSHLKDAQRRAVSLLDSVRNTVKSIQIDNSLDDTVLDLQNEAYRWLDNIDQQLQPYFDEADSYARQLIRLHFIARLTGKSDIADRLKELADQMLRLSWGTSNADYMLVEQTLPELKIAILNLDLSQDEIELLSVAAKTNGQIHKLTVNAIPGGFIKIGDRVYATESEPRQTARYVEALDRLIAKNLVTHVSNNKLFQLTGAGWSRISPNSSS